MSKKISLFLVSLSLLLSGCAFMRPAETASKNKSPAPFPSYSGLKARATVADFKIRSVRATAEIGSELRQILIAALVNSNHFSVSSTADSGAELIISATVAEFEPQASGGSAGIGGGGGAGSGFLGGLLGAGSNKARMSLDIRIIDAKSTALLASRQVRGEASSVAGNFMAGFFSNAGLGAQLSGYANTPMEKAIRVCIVEATRYIWQATPTRYYKHKNSHGKEKT